MEAKQPPCLRYEPDTVSVRGLLERRTYPGRPNYESIAAGDEPETGFYLRLTAPICVAADPEAQSDSQDSVIDIQLMLDSAGYARLRPSLGSQVQLSGRLMASFTGHHHAPLLLDVLWPAAK